MQAALPNLMQRANKRHYFAFLIVWNGVISISFFYFAGLLNTIGTSESIPYIIVGLISGSLFFPLLSAFYFHKSRLSVFLSAIVALLLFTAIFLYVQSNPILTYPETLVLSFASSGGVLFSTSVYFNTQEISGGLLRQSIPVGLGSLLVSVFLFSAYLFTFYRYMPLIILSALVLCSILLIFGFLKETVDREKIV